MPMFNPTLIGSPSPVSFGAGGNSLPIGATTYFDKNPGKGYVEHNGVPVKITDSSFPYRTLTDGTLVATIGTLDGAPQRIVFTDYTFGNGVYVAVGYDNNNSNKGIIYSSTDMKSWTYRSDYTTGASQWYDGIEFGNGRFISYGQYGIKTSSDGITWSSLNTGPFQTGGYAQMIRYLNNQFVAIVVNAGYKYVFTSPDGSTWTGVGTITSSTFLYCNDIAYIPGRYVVVGGYVNGASDQQPRTWYSSDLANWSFGVGSGSSTFYPFNIVAVVGNTFVATAYKGYYYSFDGVNWTLGTLFTTGGQELRGVVSTGEYFISWDANGYFYTSANGTTWTYNPSTYPTGIYGTPFSRGHYIGGSSAMVFFRWYYTDGSGNLVYVGIGVIVAAGKNLFVPTQLPQQTSKDGKVLKPYLKVSQ